MGFAIYQPWIEGGSLPLSAFSLSTRLLALVYVHTVQRRRRRSGWSGLGRTTFQQVVGLVPKLQGRSEDETIGPGVPRKLAFAVRVRVSRNRSHSFTGGSGARRGPTGLHGT